MRNKFASRPEIHIDPRLFEKVKKEDLQFLDYPEEVYKLRDKRKPGVVRVNDSNFAAKPVPEGEVYNLWNSGIPIPEVAKAFGISISSVKTIVSGYGVDPAVIGYNYSDYVNYLREIEGLDISDIDGGRLIDSLKDKDFVEVNSLLDGFGGKKRKPILDADERSEDFVSKGDNFSCVNRYSKKEKGYEETIDGYECSYCGEEFSSKVGAKVHVSTCDEKGLQDELDGDDDSGKDTFFNGDDGDPTN